MHNYARDEAGADENINVISTDKNRKLAEDLSHNYHTRSQSGLLGWHSDISYEPIPSDYTTLKLTQLPRTGGGNNFPPPHPRPSLTCPTDTLWASACEVYDRISPPYRRFLESLTANYRQPRYSQTAKAKGFDIHSAPRGAPENVGDHLRTVHPVVRTNPVTGWKSLYAVGNHVESINGLKMAESRQLLDWFFKLVVENHDLQVRNRWQNVNDLGTSYTYS